jgi:hypothetical protein
LLVGPIFPIRLCRLAQENINKDKHFSCIDWLCNKVNFFPISLKLTGYVKVQMELNEENKNLEANLILLIRGV